MRKRYKSCINFFILSILVTLTLPTIGCSSSNNKLTDINATEEVDSETPVNVIEQALPTIMIIPSDALLRKNRCLSTIEIDGASYIKRDYQKYLINNDNNRAIIRAVQDKFIDMDFPLSDLEQALKNLNNQEMMKDVDNLAVDGRSMLLATVSPNYILDLDYNFDFGSNYQNHNKELDCVLSIVDPNTEKVLSSITLSASGKNINDALKKLSIKDFVPLSKDLKSEFTKTVKKGREVNILITVDNGSNVNLNDELRNGETLADYIIDYMDRNTKKGTYSLQRNSSVELYFNNARISNLTSNGTQKNAYKWGRDLCRDLREKLGIKAINKSQKLNEIHITIEGTL